MNHISLRAAAPPPGRVSTVCVVGAGYVGLTAAACLAALGHRVHCLERDAEQVARLRRGQVPIYEPGLDQLLADGLRSDRLRFTTEAREAVPGATVAMLCVGTPPRPDGRPDLRQLAAAATEVAAAATGDLVLAVKSTVPPGTGEALELLAALSAAPGCRVDVVSNPEFLRESQAIDDFFEPDRVVIGADEPEPAEAVADLYPPSWPMLRCDRRSAELVKCASNAFLAMKISFANEIAGLCERVGADAVPVLAGVGMDHRIGSSFLGHGPGFGGSCLGKDLSGLIATAESVGFDPALSRAARDVNAWARRRVVDRLAALLGPLAGRRVAVLGLAFKPGTDDVRDSPALAVVQGLLDQGADVSTYDPVASAPALAHLQRDDPYLAARGAEVVVVATAWPEFATLDPVTLAGSMDGHLVLDLVGSLPPAATAAAGLELSTLGRGTPDTFHPVVVAPLEWCLDAALS